MPGLDRTGPGGMGPGTGGRRGLCGFLPTRRRAFGVGMGYGGSWRVSPGGTWTSFGGADEVESLRRETALLREELAEMEKRLRSFGSGEV